MEYHQQLQEKKELNHGVVKSPGPKGKRKAFDAASEACVEAAAPAVAANNRFDSATGFHTPLEETLPNKRRKISSDGVAIPAADSKRLLSATVSAAPSTHASLAASPPRPKQSKKQIREEARKRARAAIIGDSRLKEDRKPAAAVASPFAGNKNDESLLVPQQRILETSIPNIPPNFTTMMQNPPTQSQYTFGSGSLTIVPSSSITTSVSSIHRGDDGKSEAAVSLAPCPPVTQHAHTFATAATHFYPQPVMENTIPVQTFPSSTMSGIPTPASMTMPSYPPTVAPLTKPSTITHTCTTATVNASSTTTIPMDNTYMDASNRSTRPPKKKFLFVMIGVCIIGIFGAYLHNVHTSNQTGTSLNHHNLPVQVLMNEINSSTSQSHASLETCFEDTIRIEYNENEQEDHVHESCHSYVPLLPCPGTCRNGILIECSSSLLVPSEDKTSCIPSTETTQLMSQILDKLSTSVIEKKCNWERYEDGTYFVRMAEIAAELGTEEATLKSVASMNSNIILKDDQIALTADYIHTNVDLPTLCWTKVWFVWLLRICFEYTFLFIAMMIGAVLVTLKRLIPSIMFVAYHHPLYALGCISLALIYSLSHRRKHFKHEVRTVKESALTKLASCAKDVGYPTLCLRDEIASERFPMGGRARDHFILKVWPKAAFEIRSDNRVKKTLQYVEGKGNLEYLEWICEPTRRM